MDHNDLTPSKITGQVEPTVLVRFSPTWTYIEGIREFGRFFCTATFNEPSLADRAQVIIQETLENAVKYSDDSAMTELEMLIGEHGKLLVINVRSTPFPEHFGALKREIELLNSQEPEQAYRAAFERAQKSPEASARLGLARLRYECQASVSVTEQPGGRICVTACARL